MNENTIVFLIIGFLLIHEKSFVAFLKFGNELRGTKTKITKKTLKFWKVFGYIILVWALLDLLKVIGGNYV